MPRVHRITARSARKALARARQARQGTTAARRLIGMCLARYLISPENTPVWVTTLKTLDDLDAADRALDHLCDPTAWPRRRSSRD